MNILAATPRHVSSRSTVPVLAAQRPEHRTLRVAKIVGQCVRHRRRDGHSRSARGGVWRADAYILSLRLTENRESAEHRRSAAQDAVRNGIVGNDHPHASELSKPLSAEFASLRTRLQNPSSHTIALAVARARERATGNPRRCQSRIPDRRYAASGMLAPAGSAVCQRRSGRVCSVPGAMSGGGPERQHTPQPSYNAWQQ